MVGTAKIYKHKRDPEWVSLVFGDYLGNVFASLKKSKNNFQKSIDKREKMWYTITVNEVKPPGFHLAVLHERGLIVIPLNAMGGFLCAGADASVRFLF